MDFVVQILIYGNQIVGTGVLDCPKKRTITANNGINAPILFAKTILFAQMDSRGRLSLQCSYLSPINPNFTAYFSSTKKRSPKASFLIYSDSVGVSGVSVGATGVSVGATGVSVGVVDAVGVAGGGVGGCP